MSKRERFDEEDAIRRRLAELTEIGPPEELEDRVVEVLRRSGLIAGSSPDRRLQRKLGRLAAAAALVLAGLGVGWTTGRWGGDGKPEGFQSGQYLFLLYEDSSFRAPEGAAAEYGAWVGGVRAGGHDAWGAELAADAVRLGEAAELRPGASRVTGLFLVEAPDLAAAAEVAATCPHLRYGGGIEVRSLRP